MPSSPRPRVLPACLCRHPATPRTPGPCRVRLNPVASHDPRAPARAQTQDLHTPLWPLGAPKPWAHLVYVSHMRMPKA
jgi:hypothetical protein